MTEGSDIVRMQAPSTTSAKGWRCSPGLRILSHEERGRSAARYPLPSWERIASPQTTQSAAWARLVRGRLNSLTIEECTP